MSHEDDSSKDHLPVSTTSSIGLPVPVETLAVEAIPPLDAIRALADEYEAASRADATYRAYQSDWAIFVAWCAPYGLSTLPADPNTVREFLAAQAKSGLAPATVRRRVAAIRLSHQLAKLHSPHDDPAVLRVLSGIRRKSQHQVVKKAAALDRDVRNMVDLIDPSTLPGLRDRALLLLGFAGAFRRSELVAIEVDHLIEQPEGFMIRIPKSKTDQEKEGAKIAVLRVPETAYCPVHAVTTWLAAAGITTGRVFVRIRRGHVVTTEALAGQAVARFVKRYAAKAGLLESRLSGHSLRSGFITSAAKAGASIFKIQAQSRHKSLDVLAGYVRDAELFEDHAGEGLLQTPPTSLKES